jgi:hypothetical protein
LAAGGWSVSRRRTLLDAQSPDPVLLSTFVADTDGNGRLGPADERLVQDALFTRRGFGPTPLPGFDIRADIFGRGSVGQLAVDSVRHTLETQTVGAVQAEPRPITVAWHYGWYNVLTRPPGLQTVRFKEGNYTSRDPEVEALFNNQKNEFGITIDALSWIPQRFNANLLDNYRRGLLSTANLGTRYLALLYESTIALPLRDGRIDFSNPSVPLLLREDFEQMARFLAEARDQSGGRVFTLDGRPVVFIFGSHTWGLLPVESAQFGALEVALDVARETFRDGFGSVPFLVGEEMTLSSGGTFSEDRARRMTNFDATFIYHHAPLKPLSAPGLDATLFLTPRYVEHQLGILQHNFRVVDTVRNRYTGNRVLVIPNLAPGFAKPGLPVLKMGRRDYADFMKEMHKAHLGLLAQGPWPQILGTALLPAPIYIVGSWNEEFEGHAVFPASFNLSLPEVTQQGFDLAMAIKETFGWNHFAEREIVPSGAS